MGQFAAVFVPVALQAATTAWSQYQEAALTAQQQQEQALANQAAADTATQQAEIEAQQTLETASLANEAAWDEHEQYAEDLQYQTDTSIAALQRSYALDQQDQAEALRETAASQRANFAAMGLDAASGSARAVLAGLESEARESTTQASDDLSYETTQLTESTDQAIDSNWESTSSEVRTRADQANLDVWAQQNELDLYLYNLGLQAQADERQDLLDLAASNQRALLGLTSSTLGSASSALTG